jgi:hypothetical protein
MARRKKEGGWAGPTKKHGPLHSAFFSSVQPSSLSLSLSLSLSVQPNIIYQKLHSGSGSKIKRKKQRGSQARSWCGSSEAWKQRFETGRKHTAPTGQPGLVSRIGDVLRARRWPVGHRELGPTGKISIFFQNPAPRVSAESRTTPPPLVRGRRLAPLIDRCMTSRVRDAAGPTCHAVGRPGNSN